MGTFGEWLKGQREEAGYTTVADFHAAIAAFAKSRGLLPPNVQTCYAWERRSMANLASVGLVCDFLGIPESDRWRVMASTRAGREVAS